MIFPNHPRAEKRIRRIAAGITLVSGAYLLLMIISAEYQHRHFAYSLKWSALYWLIGIIVIFGEGLFIGRLKSDFNKLGLVFLLWLSGSYVLDSYVFFDDLYHMFSVKRSERPQYLHILIFDYVTMLAALVWGMTATKVSTAEPLVKAFKIIMNPIRRFLKYERETRGIK